MAWSQSESRRAAGEAFAGWWCTDLGEVGITLVIFMAGMQTSTRPYEAARIDGAGGWQLFRSITWPNHPAINTKFL